MATLPADSASPRRSPASRAGAFRAARLLLVGSLSILVVLVLLYTTYVQAQRSYLVARNYRVLAMASRQLAAAVDGVRTLADRSPKGSSADAKSPGDPGETRLWGVSVVPRAASWEAHVEGRRIFMDPADLLPLATLRNFFDLVLLTPADPKTGAAILLTGDDDPEVASEIGELVQLEKQDGGGLLFGLFKVRSGDTAGENPEWRAAQSAPLVARYRGEDHDVFCHLTTMKPLVGKSPDDTSVRLCGLRRSASVGTEAWAVPRPILVVGLLLISGTLLAWPAFKLRLMGPRERLELWDVRVLAATALLGVSLVTFVVLSVVAYEHIEESLDGVATEFAQTFASRFREELCTVAEATETVSSKLKGRKLRLNCAELAGQNRDITDVATALPTGRVRAACWAKDAGGFVPVRPPKTVSDRQYFRDVGAGSLWRLTCGDREHRVAVESVRTRTRGRQSIAGARRVGEHTRGVAVVAARPASVIGPVVPPGLGFAVIDNDGRVMLHSDPSRNLEENLFVECDGLDVFRGAIATHRAVWLDATYYGRPHRMLVAPLGEIPWTLVVFRDRGEQAEILRLIAMRWLVLSTLCFGVILAAFVVLAILRPHYRAEWLWPDPGRATAYGWTAAALAVVLVAATQGIWQVGAAGDALLLVGVVPLTFGLVYVVLGRPSASEPRARLLAWGAVIVGGASLAAGLAGRAPAAVPLVLVAGGLAVAGKRFGAASATRGSRSLDPRYVTMIALLLLNVAAFPSILIFRDAYALTVEEFFKRAQMHYVHALTRLARDGHRGATTEAGHVDPRSVYHATLFSGRPAPGSPSGCDPTAEAKGSADSTWGLCGAAEDPTCAGFGPVIHRHLHGFTTRLLQAYAPSLALLAADRASDGTWCWGTDEELRFAAAARLGFGPDILPRSAQLPRLRDAGPHLLIGWALLALLALATLIALIRWAATRLFLLKVVGPAIDPSAPPSGPVWVYVTRPAGSRESWGDTARRPAACIDLMAASTPKDLAMLVPSAPPATMLVLDHLEARLSPEWAVELLPLLERLILAGPAAGTPPVVLVSEIDPLWFLSAQFADSEPTDKESQEVVARFWRWTQLLAACDARVVAVGPESGEQPAGTLQALLTAKAAIVPLRGRQLDDAAAWRIWAQSTKAEKLAMSQLAREGFLNPNNLEVARRLMERGLVYRAPAFEFFDPSFRAFVVRAETPGDILGWEHEAEHEGWARLERPLMIAVAVVLAFLFLTQEEVFSTFTAVLTALTGAVPLLLRFTSLLGRDRSPASDA